MGQLVSSLYTPHVVDARERFRSGIAAELGSPRMDAERFELFLIEFCARGVRMTEPVESWIYRAGQRCQAVGLTPLGRTLMQHSQHEAGHHLMMIEDTRVLVQRWNARHTPWLDVEELLAARERAGTRAYIDLHERVIESAAPYCQLGIEYEIEGLSVSWAPQLMQQAKRLLGAEIVQGMSFLVEHVEIDVGHTNLNESQLEKLLQLHPEFAEPLARAGSDALAAYGAFLTDCLAAAGERVPGPSAGRPQPAKAGTHA
jgi:hypothetical protein